MNTSMHAGLRDYEHEIVELAKARSRREARVVRIHVASCARCRAWQSAFADLDAELGRCCPSALSRLRGPLQSRLAAVTRPTASRHALVGETNTVGRSRHCAADVVQCGRGTMTVVGAAPGLLLVRGVHGSRSVLAAFADRSVQRHLSHSAPSSQRMLAWSARAASCRCCDFAPEARLFPGCALGRGRTIPQHDDLESPVGLPAIAASVAAFELLVESVHPLLLEHVSRADSVLAISARSASTSGRCGGDLAGRVAEADALVERRGAEPRRTAILQLVPLPEAYVCRLRGLSPIAARRRGPACDRRDTGRSPRIVVRPA